MKSLDAKTAVEDIICWLENYKYETNCKGVVLGISGGKDSTVVAMLAKKVWGDNVIGVLMPNGEQKDIADSLNIVRCLKLKYKIVHIESIYEALLNNVETGYMVNKCDNNGYPCQWEHIQISDKSKTNIPPRIRMTILYSIAQSFGYQVIGTGNATETFLGWFTKWGDGAHDFNPIKSLTCNQVIELGKVLCQEFNLPIEYVVKTPSDGLTGKSDEENFGFSYKDAEDVMQGKEVASDIYSKIDNMHKSTEHKRNPIPNPDPYFKFEF